MCHIYFILKKEKLLFLLSKYFRMMSNDTKPFLFYYSNLFIFMYSKFKTNDLDNK